MPEHPLKDVRVLEVGNYMAAPFAGMQLADLGAEVIKIENPDGGDMVRLSGPFIDGESSNFVRLNRNKKSLVLDLKSAAGKEIFRQLVRTADVIVENLRPGTMADLDLDYPKLAAMNPRLVYVAASGWGQDGPLADRPGLDIMAQARGGLMSITGYPDGGPAKVGVPMCDLVCALYGALAAVSALHTRERTGQGQYVDVSLFEAGVSFAVWEAGRYLATGEIPHAHGSAHQNAAPYQAIHAADGWFTLGANSHKNWLAFCQALDLGHLPADPRFVDVNARFRNRDALIAEIEQRTQSLPQAECLRLIDEAGVPCAPIQNYAEVFADPVLTERDFFWEAPHAKLGSVRQLGSPMRFSATPVRRDTAGPLFGEHSTELLTELGYNAKEIDSLMQQGIVKGPATNPNPPSTSFPPALPIVPLPLAGEAR